MQCQTYEKAAVVLNDHAENRLDNAANINLSSPTHVGRHENHNESQCKCPLTKLQKPNLRSADSSDVVPSLTLYAVKPCRLAPASIRIPEHSQLLRAA